jgi:type IV pilus assembly protein PilA
MTKITINSRGFTLVELLVVIAVIGIIAGIAVPGLLRSRMSGNEASALGSIRAILSAQADYASVNRAFADSLTTLAGSCPGSSIPFISTDLSVNGIEKSGYIFTLDASLDSGSGPIDCFGNATVTGYYLSARAVLVGTTGRRGFATSTTSAAIWQDTAGDVPTEPFVEAGTVGPMR